MYISSEKMYISTGEMYYSYLPDVSGGRHIENEMYISSEKMYISTREMYISLDEMCFSCLDIFQLKRCISIAEM